MKLWPRFRSWSHAMLHRARIERESCRDKACCERWIRHRFRRTFATSRHRDGAPLLDLKKWLGHSDLKTTELYLADSDLEGPEVRSCTNNSSAAYV